MTMNDEIKRHLGQGNCGPIELPEHEQLVIAKQIVAERMKRSNSIPWELNELDPHSCLYGDARRFCDPDIIKSYARHQDITVATATQRLAKRLGTSCGSIFGTDLSAGRAGPPHRLADTQYFSQQTGYSCSQTFPSVFHLQGTVWGLTLLQYSASDGDFIAGEAIYTNQETATYFALNVYANKIRDDVEVPCKELHLGYQHKQYRLAGEDLMIDNPDLPVSIFHDKRIAALLLGVSGLNFIPSTFGGKYNDISDVCLEPLRGKIVNLVPLASKESYQSLATQAAAILKAGAKTVLIATVPLLVQPKRTSDDEQLTIFNRLTRHIVTKSQVIGKNGELGFNLTGYCFLPPQFEKWAHEHGLTSGVSSDPPGRESISALLAKKTTLSDEYLLDTLLSPNYVSGVFGATHSGKTLFATTLALACACGLNVFTFSSHRKRHILYVHAEASGTKAASDIKQIAVGYNCHQKDLDTYFHLWSTKDRHLTSLATEEGKQQMEKEIEETKATLVIFDNFLTLAPEAVDGSSKWADLYSWFQKLSKNSGTAVLFLHHFNKEGNISGLQRIKDMTNNIFIISKKANSFQGKKGCLTSLQVQKNKEYPALDGFEAMYFLETHTHPEMGTPWHLVEDEIAESTSTVTTLLCPDDESLSPEANKVLTFITKKSRVKRKEIDQLLGCSEGTTQKYLKELLNAQRIERNGDGPSVSYALRE